MFDKRSNPQSWFIAAFLFWLIHNRTVTDLKYTSRKIPAKYVECPRHSRYGERNGVKYLKVGGKKPHWCSQCWQEASEIIERYAPTFNDKKANRRNMHDRWALVQRWVGSYFPDARDKHTASRDALPTIPPGLYMKLLQYLWGEWQTFPITLDYDNYPTPDVQQAYKNAFRERWLDKGNWLNSPFTFIQNPTVYNQERLDLLHWVWEHKFFTYEMLRDAFHRYGQPTIQFMLDAHLIKQVYGCISPYGGVYDADMGEARYWNTEEWGAFEPYYIYVPGSSTARFERYIGFEVSFPHTRKFIQESNAHLYAEKGDDEWDWVQFSYITYGMVSHYREAFYDYMHELYEDEIEADDVRLVGEGEIAVRVWDKTGAMTEVWKEFYEKWDLEQGEFNPEDLYYSDEYSIAGLEVEADAIASICSDLRLEFKSFLSETDFIGMEYTQRVRRENHDDWDSYVEAATEEYMHAVRAALYVAREEEERQLMHEILWAGHRNDGLLDGLEVTDNGEWMGIEDDQVLVVVYTYFAKWVEDIEDKQFVVIRNSASRNVTIGEWVFDEDTQTWDYSDNIKNFLQREVAHYLSKCEKYDVAPANATRPRQDRTVVHKGSIPDREYISHDHDTPTVLFHVERQNWRMRYTAPGVHEWYLDPFWSDEVKIEIYAIDPTFQPEDAPTQKSLDELLSDANIQ